MTERSFENDDVDDAPIAMLAAFFEANGWAHEHVNEDELVATTQGSWANYELRAIWRDDDQVLQLLVFPDIRVLEPQRAPVWEVIGLVNEQLWLGHFEMWSTSGIVLFRHGVLLNAAETLGLDQARTLVETAIDECERFYPVFQFVLWGGKSPGEAIAAAMIETRGEA